MGDEHELGTARPGPRHARELAAGELDLGAGDQPLDGRRSGPRHGRGAAAAITELARAARRRDRDRQLAHRAALGGRFAAERVWFSHPEPGDSRRLHEAFGTSRVTLG